MTGGRISPAATRPIEILRDRRGRNQHNSWLGYGFDFDDDVLMKTGRIEPKLVLDKPLSMVIVPGVNAHPAGNFRSKAGRADCHVIAARVSDIVPVEATR
jgi:hypothetical protein